MAVVKLAGNMKHRVLAGHPWVYGTEVSEISGDFQPGDLVEVIDQRGRFVGRGYINPASQILVRILSRDSSELIDRDFFVRRIKAALAYRRHVVRDSDSCRLIYAEADFIPALIVDKFGAYLVLQTLALGIDKYKDLIVDILEELLEPPGIYERNDAAVRELEGLPLKSGFLKGPFETLVEIKENGLYFLVDLAGGQKTGYFLDQRENRTVLQGLARDARVLDCFCHTGAFSVYAAHFGAKEVHGIDIASPALAVAEKNALRNGFGGICRFYEGNVFDELRALEKKKEKYDLIILDPPAFTKSRNSLEGAVRGYKEINLRAMKLLPPGGFLVTCTCSYHLPESRFLDVIQDAARDAGRQARLIELRRQAKDHPMLLAAPETYYLKCAVTQVW
ncbi:class I SAM-dependent rRNA methyltransferase [Pelotomaculum propionicicum]|uniref:Ribosomal RNA large subunit methyltransferase I n=1 Tax=Pelotomaculum propionicicum TaxID=258475 RepID=A0A4Y7RTL7_9FIRM|nr:class I SAM-dependent rRNA methyltransferase [Pelotomaculum propionicicum]TEB12069.1 Ribosomal RNA large subunit methyltransferase I [Pelotomaculum propionicicum]